MEENTNIQNNNNNNSNINLNAIWNCLKNNFVWILVVVTIFFAIYVFSQIKNDNKKLAEISQKIEQKQAQINFNEDLSQHIYHLETLKETYRKTKNDSIRKELASEIESKKEVINQLKDKISDNKKEIVELKEKFGEEKKELWTHQIEYFALIIALLVGLIFFNNLEHLTKEKMEKEISKITGREIKHIRDNYEEFITHRDLRKNSKIIILNKKGTPFSDSFKKVITLFGVNPESDKIELENLEEANNPEITNRLKEYDLVIIDDPDKTQNAKPWFSYISDMYKYDTKEQVKDKKHKIEEELDAYISLRSVITNPANCTNENHQKKINKIEIFSTIKCPLDLYHLYTILNKPVNNAKLYSEKACNDQWINQTKICLERNLLNDEIKEVLTKQINNTIRKLQENLETFNNQLSAIKLTDKICDKTAVLYFGHGTFPARLVEPDKQHMITFANAPSQLYGNLLSMLKFQYELRKNK